MHPRTYSATIGESTISLTHSDLAQQAHGAAICRSRDTLVLATAVMDDEPQTHLDFVPLTVDYEERYYAAGEILGSRYRRREGKPSETATLTARAVDRSVRPLFPKDLRCRVHIVITVLALGDMDPDVLAINAASAALAQAPIPWNGPVAAVRATHDANDNRAVNAAGIASRHDSSKLTCLIAGTEAGLTMVEGGASESTEEAVAETLECAHGPLKAGLDVVTRYAQETSAQHSHATTPHTIPDTLQQLFSELSPEVDKALSSERNGTDTETIAAQWRELVAERAPEHTERAEYALRELLRHRFTQGILAHGERPDGRTPTQLRPVQARAGGVSSAVHGSGIFYRGSTHVLSILTLGALDDRQLIGTMETPDAAKRFLHHYNFPPYSVGETGKITGPGRREIGHGALGERALRPVLPERESFPHTIRLVAEVMSSNGSTSMGAVCAGSLALMDGGVPITRHVAGVAIGLARDEAGEYRLLTDIQGPEDAYGDMDCKVAGTREGITALQVDVKDRAVEPKIVREALSQARSAHHELLDHMGAAIEAPRRQLNPAAPTTDTMRIPHDSIGAVIGSGGSTIQDIIAQSGVDDIAIDDDGSVTITGPQAAADRAKERIRAIVADTHE